ncbi:Cos5p [Saccharomyces cerevisiae Vin13]|nr:Cos5p [Saccharomyces cerevisiae Vin13]
MLTISDEGESNDLFFITRWFSYVDIIGSLSSTSKVITSEKLRAIKYKFEKMTDQENWSRRRINLKDIEAGTGLEAKVLSYLASSRPTGLHDFSVLNNFHCFSTSLK